MTNDDALIPTPCTPEQQAAARRTICGNVIDADEARELLDMLGLLEVTP